MESSSSCLVKNNGGGRNIVNQLPIGFRFRPTDEELVVHYLRRKVFSLPLPASVVRDDFDVFRIHPSHLPGDLKEKRYFFSNNVMMMSRFNGVNVGGDLLGGYWKVNVKRGKVILGNGNNQAVGLKRCLVYYQGKQKTNWMMHEFRLLATHSITKECTTLMEIGDWVLCRIYQKKEKSKGKMVKMTIHDQHNYSSFSTNKLSETFVKGSSTLSVVDSTMTMDVIDDGGCNGGLVPPPPPQDCSSSDGDMEVLCNDVDDEEACTTSAPTPPS